MSDRIAVMEGGRILQVGSPEEIYERPAHPLRGGLHRPHQPAGGDGGGGTPERARGCRLLRHALRVPVRPTLPDSGTQVSLSLALRKDRRRTGRRPEGTDRVHHEGTIVQKTFIGQHGAPAGPAAQWPRAHCRDFERGECARLRRRRAGRSGLVRVERRASSPLTLEPEPDPDPRVRHGPSVLREPGHSAASLNAIRIHCNVESRLRASGVPHPQATRWITARTIQSIRAFIRGMRDDVQRAGGPLAVPRPSHSLARRISSTRRRNIGFQPPAAIVRSRGGARGS